MKIKITDTAKQIIIEQASDTNSHILVLQYDTDGCGCVVNGVSNLVEITEDKLTGEELLIETEPKPFRVAIQKRVEWVYDNELIIDFSDSANMLQLKSPNQMINPRMTFNPLQKTEV
ncbi:iron-sulfur cluster biosynthesis family protein [Salipaludibacillus sp. HK11]|uniref:iron-sulfur cluster biosynthesis family protein n=1 Tax=Salipaludibacillus sp. HK11 TaxID=3394320 RepID=UPI0039FB97ED